MPLYVVVSYLCEHNWRLPFSVNRFPSVAHSRRECGFRVVSERLVGARTVICVTARASPLPQSRRDWATINIRILQKSYHPHFRPEPRVVGLPITSILAG